LDDGFGLGGEAPEAVTRNGNTRRGRKVAAVARRRNLSISATILEAEQGSKRSKEEITAEVCSTPTPGCSPGRSRATLVQRRRVPQKRTVVRPPVGQSS
jgi:hypothetical protein